MSNLRLTITIILLVISFNCFSNNIQDISSYNKDVFIKYSAEVKKYPIYSKMHKPFKTAEVTKKKRYVKQTKSSQRALANVIYCENNGSEKSMRLVASVIHNRLIDGNYERYENVIYKKGQFECAGVKLTKINEQKYKVALSIADEMLNSKFKPVTSASYFYSTLVHKRPPRWIRKMNFVLHYEGHAYYS